MIWIQLVIILITVTIVARLVYMKALLPFMEAVDKLSNTYKGIKEQTDILAVLNEIVGQFRIDGGASMRDVVNRLDDAATANRVAIESTRLTIEAAKILSETDRETAARLEKLLNQVSVKADVAAGATTAAAVLAAGVANDLENSHLRAEAHGNEAAPGEAADAASRRPTSE